MIASADLLLRYQSWRHFGEFVLVLGPAAEIALIAFLDWRLAGTPDDVIDKRRKVVGEGLAAALILIGVGIENWAGRNADDVIRRMQAFRSLTLAQQMRIGKKLAAYQNEDIDILPYRGNIEAWWIAEKIRLALMNQAGWKKVHVATVTEYNRAFSGIFVETTVRSKPEDITAANALTAALTAEGLVIYPTQPTPTWLRMDVFGDIPLPDTSTIHLTVGVKPPEVAPP